MGPRLWPALALLCFQASAQQPLEYQVKAAFLLNFTKFIEWPPTAFSTPDAPLTLCILGADPFGSALDQIVAGEVVNGRKLSVERIKRAPGPQSCQVLYVGSPEKETLKILSGVGPRVLTVGEGAGFLRSGGIIAFVIDNRRVRFDIHQATAENAGLALSSKLLSVARSVDK
jgi:YfiR/HmsC-like